MLFLLVTLGRYFLLTFYRTIVKVLKVLKVVKVPKVLKVPKVPKQWFGKKRQWKLGCHTGKIGKEGFQHLNLTFF